VRFYEVQLIQYGASFRDAKFHASGGGIACSTEQLFERRVSPFTSELRFAQLSAHKSQKVSLFSRSTPTHFSQFNELDRLYA
jgi:hypothetical protein